MKKILVFAMILCTLLLALTGCSNNAEPEATEAPAATEAPVEEPATEEPAAEEPAAEEPAAEAVSYTHLTSSVPSCAVEPAA